MKKEPLSHLSLVLYLSFFVFLTLPICSRATVTATVQGTTITLELLTLPELTQQYLEAGHIDDPAAEQAFLEMQLRELWIHSVSGEILGAMYEDGLQSGETYLTLQEFTTDIWPEIQLFHSNVVQYLQSKRPYIADFEASGMTPEQFYTSRPDLEQAFESSLFVAFDDSIDIWLWFVDRFPEVDNVDAQIAIEPTNPQDAYAIYRTQYEFERFANQWAIDRLNNVDPTVVPEIETISDAPEGYLLMLARRRFILEDYQGDIVLGDPQAQADFDAMLQWYLAVPMPPPLDRVFDQ